MLSVAVRRSLPLCRRLASSVSPAVGEICGFYGVVKTEPERLAAQRGQTLKRFKSSAVAEEGTESHVNTTTLNVPIGQLNTIDITWEQWGDVNAPDDKTVVIFPSFSHGSHAKSNPSNPSPGWWEFMIGPNEYIDTNKYRVICPSFLGSPYGATSPLSVNPETGTLEHPYGPNFPQITPADMARGHAELLKYLGIEKVHAVVGGSLGGMQTIAFMSLFPDMVDRACVISGTARTSPFSSALRLVQRKAIEGDPEFYSGFYNTPGMKGDGPVDGLKAARMMGMMWYRSREEFDRRFEWGVKEELVDKQIEKANSGDKNTIPGASTEVQSYLDYQAAKFSNNFDANCYLLLSRAMDTFDLGCSAKNIVPGFKEAAPPGETKEERLYRALNRVTAKVQVIGVVQDALIPIGEQKEVYNGLSMSKKDVNFISVDDEHGHDAMFNQKVCLEKFAPAICSFIDACPDAMQDIKVQKEAVKNEVINPNELGSFTRTIMGAQAAKIIDELPFHLPYDDWLRHVGNTPLVETDEGLHAKLEGANPGGSIKDRALTAIFLNKFITGELRANGSTLALVTSGWAGLSLAKLHKSITDNNDFDLNLVVVVPYNYKDKVIPSQIVALDGVTTFYGGFDEYLEARDNGNLQRGGVCLVFEQGTFLESLEYTHQVVKKEKWVLVDQHHDVSGMNAHASTALELMCQLPDMTDVVCATGTGATAAGLRQYLPNSVRVHARPAMSGTVDGLTDVNRYNNFCDGASLQGYNSGEHYELDHAIDFQEKLWSDHKIRAGHSSGATFWLANTIREANPDAKIGFICADGRLTESQNDQPIGRLSAVRQFSSTPDKAWRPSLPGVGRRRNFSTSSARSSRMVDHIVVGGGPVGTATASHLGERNFEVEDEDGESILLIHDPKNPGAHEDWSRLARLSFDGPEEELELSRHAVELLQLVDEVRSYQSGAPVVPVSPGMLFLASPNTPMAQACAHAEENYGDPDFIRRDPKELEALYPGNEFSLPDDTLCWSHPIGLCVSPIELCSAQLKTAEAYGVEIKEGIAKVDVEGGELVKVTMNNGEEFLTKKCYVFAGAQNGEIFEDAVKRDSVGNADLAIPEFDDTYITAISTVRYGHVNHPAKPAPGSGHVVTPITLGQLEIPGLIDFQANFSIVAEEYGDVLKTRLSGSIGTEVIPYVKDKAKNISAEDDQKMADIYQNFFGALFPFLDTAKPLDFNRCVTYRNHRGHFSGTSILEKPVGGGGASVLTTAGCFGVGVKFGPALGEAAAAHTAGDGLEVGMEVFQSGFEGDEVGEKIERAW
ncbi:hypothetical protein TrLO_g4174 [Triparma laevis f. longispina]|uniref:Homoserine O-acetyltransferase n=1 Tax=Triparma laevis f. longispina TaxID=1714387 RepID=A0A9W7FHT3_9STRA|nr:hypothetical protein TrLO_g4174 [Triparma laevis f. longispina]